MILTDIQNLRTGHGVYSIFGLKSSQGLRCFFLPMTLV